jgi:hypothetical protein
MGGSGGGGFFTGSVGPDELSRRTRESQEAAEDARFETEISDMLASELAQYNDRNAQGIQDILQIVTDELEDEIEGSVDLLFGGSIAKHTYIDGLSDVDALVLLNRADIAGKSPEYLKKAFVKCLRARFGKDAVHVGDLAVSLNIQDTWIQLLPALREGKAFKIASSDGRGWATIKPRNFARALTKANDRLNGKLVPTIKLAKAIIATLPEQRRLTGYHTESMAINVFRGYAGPQTPKAMIRHFFEQAASHVREPIRDTSGQSVHVDEYLGEANSLPRQIVADALGRIARTIKNADGARSVQMWRDVLGRE